MTDKKWIAAWGCAINKTPRTSCEWMRDVTVRFNVFMTVPGSALRFHFSNIFGKHPATVTAATVALSAGDRGAVADSITDITFNGNLSGTMQGGGDMVSDEIKFDFAAGQTLTVSLYFADFTHLTTAHANDGPFIEKWVVDGDYTHSAELEITDDKAAEAYPFINTIDALCDSDCYTIVAFGDSITAQSWPDRLIRRIHELGIKNVAVVRRGISGSRVLREYPNAELRKYGPAGIKRFSRDIACAGVKKVFILHGINDIIHPRENGSIFRPITDEPTSDELIAGLKYYIDIARQNDLEVYLSPILPFKGWSTYCERKNNIRLGVNKWVRECADVNGILPFEDAVKNPEDPYAMIAEYDSGDHLHPSNEGAHALAYSIPEEFFN